MTEAARIWTTVGANVAPLMAGLAQASAATESFARKLDAQSALMRKTGQTLTKELTLPIVAVGVEAAKSAITFQNKMSLIQTSAGATTGDVKKLSAAVLEMAKSSQYGPQQLADALYHLKSLGYDNVTAMKALAVSVKGAAAGHADLESTASALGAAIRVNIKGAGDFNRAMGTLVATVGAGNMKMDDLVSAMGTNLLATAKTAGLSLKDVGSALALMTDEGQQADAAATHLRMAITLMGGPSTQAAKALSLIGINTLDLGHAMQGPQGLIGAITLLKTHLDQIQDPAARFALLSKAFGGARSAGTIMQLVNTLGVLQQKYDQVGKNAGNLNKNALAAQHTQLAQLKTAWSNIQVALIHFGSTLAPIAVAIAKDLSGFAGWLDKLNPETKKLLEIFAGGLAVGGPMLLLFSRAVTLVKALRTAMLLLGGVEVKTAVAGAGSAVKTGVAAEVETTTTKVAGLRTALLGLGKLGAIAVSIVLTEKLQQELGAGGGHSAAYNFAHDINSKTGKQGLLGDMIRGLGNVTGLYKFGAGTNDQMVQRGVGAASAAQINAYAKKYGLPPALVAQVIAHESSGNPSALSNAGAVGLMQVEPGTAGLTAAALMNPATNLNAGTKYLSSLVSRYGDLRTALIAYNEGPNALSKYGPYKSSQNYADSILKASGLSGGKMLTPVGPSAVTANLSSGRAKLVQAAISMLGTPYAWGGNAPGGFDCSGFVQWVFSQAGVSLPHFSGAQFSQGIGVSKKDIQPGDVVFTNFGENEHGAQLGPGTPGHEGIYIGGDKVAEAPHTGASVTTTSLASFISGGKYAIRDFSPGLHTISSATVANFLKNGKKKKPSIASMPAVATEEYALTKLQSKVSALPDSALKQLYQDQLDKLNTQISQGMTSVALQMVKLHAKELTDQVKAHTPAKLNLLSSVLPQSFQVALAKAQTTAIGSPTKTNENTVVSAAKKALDYLNAEHETGAKLVELERERKTLAGDIAAAHGKITAQIRAQAAAVAAAHAKAMAEAAKNSSGDATFKKSFNLTDWVQQQANDTSVDTKITNLVKKWVSDASKGYVAEAKKVADSGDLAKATAGMLGIANGQIVITPAGLDLGGTTKAQQTYAKQMLSQKGLAGTITKSLGALFKLGPSDATMSLDEFKSQRDALVAQAKQLSKDLTSAILSPTDLASVKSKQSALNTAIQTLMQNAQAMIDAKKQTLSSDMSSLVTDIDDAFDQHVQQHIAQMQTDFQAKLAAFQKQSQAQIDAFDAQTQTGLQAIQDKYAAPTPSEAALSALQDQSNVSNLQGNLSTAQTQLSGAQAQMSAAQSSGDAAAIAAAKQPLLDAQKAVSDAQIALQEDALQKKATVERTAADKQSTADQKAYQVQRDAQKQALQDQLNAQQQAMQDQESAAEKSYQDAETLLKQHMDNQLATLNKGLADGTISVDTFNTDVAQILGDAGVPLSTIGDGLGQAWSESFDAALASTRTDLNDLLSSLNAVRAVTGQPSVPTLSDNSGSGSSVSGGNNVPILSSSALATMYNVTNAKGYRFGGAMATGGTRVVTEPTVFIAGEAGPEVASFTPLRGRSKTADVPITQMGPVMHVENQYIQDGVDAELVASVLSRKVAARFGQS